MKTFKKAISVMLSLAMVFGAVTISGSVANLKASAVSLSVGDLVEFGTYPQSEVTDSATLNELNGKTLNWISYRYYSGEGTLDDGRMTAKDFMEYADVTVDGIKYRAVKFTEYRTIFIGRQSSASNSYQDDNGYETNNTYWFKFEPIKWRVLDPATGLILCESIIDSQAFNNYCLEYGGENWGNSEKTYYTSNYAQSSIRAWLNNDFYNTAFSSADKGNIKIMHLENKAYPADDKYNCDDTDDKVFLLSYSDALNTNYGFSSNAGKNDEARRAQGTDYAKCQGLFIGNTEEYEGNSHWRLRTPGPNSYDTCYVTERGYTKNKYEYTMDNTCYGIRAAIEVSNLNELPSGNETYVLTYNANGGAGAPETQTGGKRYIISSTIPTRNGHSFLGWSLSSTATTATYIAGNNITLTENTTLYAVWSQVISIKNYVASRTVDYKTTITFTANVENSAEGAEIVWYVNGNESGRGNSLTVKQATADFTVQCKTKDAGNNTVESEIETVKVKSGFFDKIIAFFRSIFRMLPSITQ